MASAVLAVASEQVFDERVFGFVAGQGLEGVTDVTKIILDNPHGNRYTLGRQSGDCRPTQKGNTMGKRTWRVVRVTPIRPEATREIIAEFDTSEAAWAEHDRLYYHTENERGVYYQVVRIDGTTV